MNATKLPNKMGGARQIPNTARFRSSRRFEVSHDAAKIKSSLPPGVRSIADILPIIFAEYENAWKGEVKK